MTFLNPLDALIPKIPFSFFPDFWVWVTSEAQGSVLVGFWGSCQLSPFSGGAVRPEGSIDPPPPLETKTRPPLASLTAPSPEVPMHIRAQEYAAAMHGLIARTQEGH